MHKVIINNKIYLAENGTVLSDILKNNYIYHEHICNGMGICKKCTVLVNGKKVLSCQYKITSDITVSTIESEDIYSETGVTETRKTTENCCFCLDIGTSTLALALVSLDENAIIKVSTCTNPQRIFGADVISRIDYCQKNGVKEMHRVLINKVNELIESFKIETVKEMYVSGNTTMLHLFFGVDCSQMGVSPYTPVFLESKRKNAKSLNITGVETIESLPSVSAFFGADLVAGMNFTGTQKNGRYNLILDLGTNAEIVLFSDKNVFCTSAAAGPCFEGGNISHGMSATSGAVYSYSKNKVRVINNTIPKGICGTGLIDVIAVFLENNIIDKTGFLESDEVEITNGVFIEQNDVRQYQLAKSAIFSGIVTLLKEKNVSYDDIDCFYISGGFSSVINIENAVKTGLFPKELKEKCVTINNSSLLGTIKYAYEKNDLSQYTEKAEYIDLSLNSYFCVEFIKNINF